MKSAWYSYRMIFDRIKFFRCKISKISPKFEKYSLEKKIVREKLLYIDRFVINIEFDFQVP